MLDLEILEKKCVLTTSDKSAIRGPCRNDERLPNFQ